VIAVWETATWQQISYWTAHPGRINVLVFGGRTLFSASSCDTTVKGWDAASEREEHSYAMPVDWVTGVAVSPDGRTLAVAGGSFHRPGEVRLLDIDTGHVRHHCTVPVNTVRGVAFTPDGQTLIAGTVAPISLFTREWRGSIHRWDLGTGQEMPPLP
jgi:WD40 repeat protein